MTGQRLDKGAALALSHTTWCMQCQYLKSAIFSLYLVKRLDGGRRGNVMTGKEDVLLS